MRQRSRNGSPAFFGLRSRNLHAGVKNLIGNEYAQKIYDHPLIKNLAKRKKLPSYIAPETMSAVLLEVVAKDNDGKSYGACSADEVRDIVGKIPQGDLKNVLDALLDNSADVDTALKDRLTEWFDEGITRVSGWYKRQVQVSIVVIAVLVTLATNASSIHIAEELWRNDALRASLAAQAETADNQNVDGLQANNLEQLESFPIGWDVPPDGSIWQTVALEGWLKTILGWIITIAAVSLGAPFWFDLLSKVANLRGSGGKAKTPKTA